MRMLSKFIVAGAFGAIIVATAAQAEDTAPKQRFTHEGYTYVYDVKDTGATRIISGRRFPDNVAFNLSVRNGRVTGVSDGKQVAFTVKEARGAVQN